MYEFDTISFYYFKNDTKLYLLCVRLEEMSVCKCGGEVDFGERVKAKITPLLPTNDETLGLLCSDRPVALNLDLITQK